MLENKLTQAAARYPLLVATSDYTTSYGGALRLANSLISNGADLEMWAYMTLANAARSPLPVNTPYQGMASRLPVVRHWYFKMRMLIRAMRTGSAFLCYHTRYVDVAMLYKRLRPLAPVIMVCPELFTLEDKNERHDTSIYAKWADLPDLTIDVDAARAQIRRKTFGLKKEVLVLPNTLPLAEINRSRGRQVLRDVAGCSVPEGVPIIVYTGALHEEVRYADIVEALAMLRKPFFFIACSPGPAKRRQHLALLVRERLGPARGVVVPPLPRPAMLSLLCETTIGVIYYPVSEKSCLNVRYAAPGKFYEYVAAGLPVVSSGNETMRKLINEGNIGVCCQEDTPAGLRDAFETALAWDLVAMRQRCLNIFRDKWCYEKVSPPIIQAIMKCIGCTSSNSSRPRETVVRELR